VKRRIGSAIGMKLAFIMRVFSLRAAYGVALFPVLWYYLLRPEGRRSAAALYRRLGLKGGAFRRFFFGLRQAIEYSKIIMDNLYLGAFGDKHFELEKFGTDVFLKALEGGRGLILISAHVGNWHLAVNFLGNTNTHVNLVMDDVRQEEVRRQMDMAKASRDHLTVRSAGEGPALVFELSAALKRGEVVIIAGDRSAARGRRAKLPFFGKEAWFPTSAFFLAAGVGAPVCTAFTFRTGMRKYRCFGIGPFAPSADAADGETRSREMAQAFVDSLETHVRKHPTQWFNFYDFWEDPT